MYLCDATISLQFEYFLFLLIRMNIFVSNISWGTKSESLFDLFSQFGEVSSANIINDRETGRSRGFGFVEMPNDGQRGDTQRAGV